MVPWNSASGGFAYIWQSKKGGIIAIKTEGTQIHFLSDVLATVASLDLKVPIECFHSRGQHLCKFIRTKERVCIRKEFNSHRIGLGHQYGRRDVMWKHSIETAMRNESSHKRFGNEVIMDLKKIMVSLAIKRLTKKRPRQDSNLESPDS